MPAENGVPQGADAKDETVKDELQGPEVTDKANVPEDIYAFYEKMDHDDDETELQTVSFEISQDKLEPLQKR